MTGSKPKRKSDEPKPGAVRSNSRSDAPAGPQAMVMIAAASLQEMTMSRSSYREPRLT